jgi:SAM-dependent methyltransferase
MSATHDFIVALARTHCPPPCRLLDFGCGAGEVFEIALQSGFDAYGVDSFSDVWVQYAERAAALGDRIRHVLDGAALPFPDSWFDVVVCNQVMEHIAEPAFVIAEFSRVLRADGVLVAIFPTREIVVEPHLKAPFIHWFTPGSPAQARMLALVHALGLGVGAKEPRAAWIAGAADSLRRLIFYRGECEAIATFLPPFRLVARAEPEFMRDRVARSPRFRRFAQIFAPRSLDPILRMLCVRLANVVLVFRRATTSR